MDQKKMSFRNNILLGNFGLFIFFPARSCYYIQEAIKIMSAKKQNDMLEQVEGV